MSQEVHEAGPENAQVLSVFDFDGTLTRRDSFVPFLLFAFGWRAFVPRMVRMVPSAIGFITQGLSRDELKATLIASFLTGVREDWIKEQAENFRKAFWTRLMRPSGLKSVADEVASGATVTICSASPSLVLHPFAIHLGVQLIGTELEVKDGLLTGNISGSNCRCEAKVHRLEAVYGDLSRYRLRAWGDTRGDHELLAAAQDAHWRHFHPAWRRGRFKIEKIGARVKNGTETLNSVTGVPSDLPGKNDQKGV